MADLEQVLSFAKMVVFSVSKRSIYSPKMTERKYRTPSFPQKQCTLADFR